MVDPLRVEVVLPAPLFGSVKAGATVMVTPEFPGAAPREAKVTLVDKLVDGVSNTFRLRLSLPNPGGRLPAGLRCKADLGAAVAGLDNGVAGRRGGLPTERTKSSLRPAAYMPAGDAATLPRTPGADDVVRTRAQSDGLRLRNDDTPPSVPARRTGG